MKSVASEKIVLAMGCFWQPDYIFSRIKGVTSTRVGYTGCKSSCKNPSYEDVCSETTGCAESIEITFNPKQITFEQILDIFWENHNPTELDRQGLDVGSQYRSAIFYHSDTQKEKVLASKLKWEKRLLDKTKKIVTQIAPASLFYEAESYHQKYLDKTGSSCHIPRKVFRS